MLASWWASRTVHDPRTRLEISEADGFWAGPSPATPALTWLAWFNRQLQARSIAAEWKRFSDRAQKADRSLLRAILSSGDRLPTE